MGRQPYSSRAFLIRWQDRVLFGTDRYPGRPDQPRHRLYYRLLETADEYFKYYDHPFPPTGEWRVYGLHLPDPVLRKIYQSNADRVLGWRVRDRQRQAARLAPSSSPVRFHTFATAVASAPPSVVTHARDGRAGLFKGHM
jgi:hypothetical protein